MQNTSTHKKLKKQGGSVTPPTLMDKIVSFLPLCAGMVMSVRSIVLGAVMTRSGQILTERSAWERIYYYFSSYESDAKLKHDEVFKATQEKIGENSYWRQCRSYKKNNTFFNLS